MNLNLDPNTAALLQIILGATMTALGYHDFQTARARAAAKALGTTGSDSDSDSDAAWFDRLDRSMFPNQDDDTQLALKRITAFLLISSGLMVCVLTLVGGF